MTAIEIKIVLMNVDIPSNSTKKLADWKMELQKYVDKLLTPSENPPNYIIFYQEGCKDPKPKEDEPAVQEKDSFLSQKMGKYAVKSTEEGSGKTNGLIHPTDFNLTAPTKAIKTELNIPKPNHPKKGKNPHHYFFMFDSHRFFLAIYSYGENMKSLMVSFHAPNIADGLNDIEKAKNIEHYLTFFDQVRVAHGCQTMIVAGDFNIKYSAIQSDCQSLLDILDLKVMGYDLEFVPVNERTATHYGHHRAQNPNGSTRGRKKEKVDTVIYSKIISRVSSVVIDKDIPADVMDHHAILVTLKLPNQAEMVQWEEDKALTQALTEGIAWLRL
jgi:hypothetical protein